VIPKGGADAVRAAGLDAFLRSVATIVPEVADRVDELREWDQVKLLSVQSNRLERWHKPGYLAIGDAAHAMSPIAGVGINPAVQDAVVAANVLWGPLRRGRVTAENLAEVQRRRELPVRLTQAAQAFIQDRFVTSVLASDRPRSLPVIARVLTHVPLLRDLPGRLVGFGVRRPRVECPALIVLAR